MTERYEQDFENSFVIGVPKSVFELTRTMFFKDGNSFFTLEFYPETEMYIGTYSANEYRAKLSEYYKKD